MATLPEYTSDNYTQAADSFAQLMAIVDELREKCPWDRKQTKESIRHLTIEETYELSDAILADDYPEMEIELGDLLMHMIFYASLARDKGKFDMHQSLETQIEKLVRRHPHIYGDMVGASEEAIRANWEQVKAKERAMKGEQDRSVLDGVPNSLPALIQAQRMQEKAAGIGFDWDQKEEVWGKVEEEIAEFKEAQTADEREAEMGDLLFALVNYCRHAGINAEDALARSSRKFKNRFQHVEIQARAKQTELKDMTLPEMDALWNEAKKELG